MIACFGSCEKSRFSRLLRGESLTAFAAPACNHFCTGMRFHPIAKTAYLTPLSTVWLKSLFHRYNAPSYNLNLSMQALFHYKQL